MMNGHMHHSFLTGLIAGAHIETIIEGTTHTKTQVLKEAGAQIDELQGSELKARVEYIFLRALASD